jgi:RimJ/RimL family protein N-acetyltransferase
MRQLRLARLEATVFDDNPASARVLLANGFAEEGRMRRAVVDRHGMLHDLRLFARIEDSNGIRPDE